jgi:uncharacterized protein (TIGR03435 family)
VLQIIPAQRFKLAVHRETRATNVFLLEVAPGGPKLDETPAWNMRLGAGTCQPGRHGIVCEMMSMPELAWWLQQYGVAPIFDRTELKGVYDFILHSSPGAAQAPVEIKVWAIQDQVKSLGLTIKQRKKTTEVLVVDHCEKKPIKNSASPAERSTRVSSSPRLWAAPSAASP